jgi:hypothetical protein
MTDTHEQVEPHVDGRRHREWPLVIGADGSGG